MRNELQEKISAYIDRRRKVDSKVLFFGSAQGVLFSLSAISILSFMGSLLGYLFLEGYKRVLSREGSLNITIKDKIKSTFACSGIISLFTGGVLLSGIAELINKVSDDFFYFQFFSSFDERQIFPRIALFFTPLICGFLFAVFHSLNISRAPDKSTFVGVLHRSTGLLCLLTVWGVIALSPTDDVNGIILIILFSILLLGFLTWIIWRDRTRMKSTFPLLRAGISGWICVVSTIILVLLIMQSTIDHSMRNSAENYLYGEMSLLHDVQDSP